MPQASAAGAPASQRTRAVCAFPLASSRNLQPSGGERQGCEGRGLPPAGPPPPDIERAIPLPRWPSQQPNHLHEQRGGGTRGGRGGGKPFFSRESTQLYGQAFDDAEVVTMHRKKKKVCKLVWTFCGAREVGGGGQGGGQGARGGGWGTSMGRGGQTRPRRPVDTFAVFLPPGSIFLQCLPAVCVQYHCGTLLASATCIEYSFFFSRAMTWGGRGEGVEAVQGAASSDAMFHITRCFERGGGVTLPAYFTLLCPEIHSGTNPSGVCR